MLSLPKGAMERRASKAIVLGRKHICSTNVQCVFSLEDNECMAYVPYMIAWARSL